MLRKSYNTRMDKKLLELYSDYIISSFGQITATGLSRVLEGSIRNTGTCWLIVGFPQRKIWLLLEPAIFALISSQVIQLIYLF